MGRDRLPAARRRACHDQERPRRTRPPPRHRSAAPRRPGAVLPFLRRQDAEGRAGGVRPRSFLVIASAAKQSIYPRAEAWIASRSLSSGARSRDPLARNDGTGPVELFSRSPLNCKILLTLT